MTDSTTDYMRRLKANLDLCDMLEQYWSHDPDMMTDVQEFRKEIKEEMKEHGSDGAFNGETS